MSRFVAVPAARLLGELRAIGKAVKESGGSYTEITQGHREIVACISGAHHAGEVRIYTSLAEGEDVVRDCGEDAVRIVVGFVGLNGDFRPFYTSRKLLRTAPKGSEGERIQAFLDRLRAAVREAYKLVRSAPRCPKCGAYMVERKGSRGRFYGCLQYPRCRGTRELEIQIPEVKSSKGGT